VAADVRPVSLAGSSGRSGTPMRLLDAPIAGSRIRYPKSHGVETLALGAEA
jgi:hypothetical protein